MPYLMPTTSTACSFAASSRRRQDLSVAPNIMLGWVEGLESAAIPKSILRSKKKHRLEGSLGPPPPHSHLPSSYFSPPSGSRIGTHLAWGWLLATLPSSTSLSKAISRTPRLAAYLMWAICLQGLL